MEKETETITTETEVGAFDNDWDDMDLSDVADDDPDEEREAEDKGEADHSEGPETEEKPAETETETKGDEGADHSFTLKHLDEVKEYSRDEVVALAQKGLDYDRIRQRLSEKEAAEKQHKDILDFVTELAGGQGANLEEFMLNYRAGKLAAKENISPEDAKKQLQMQARERALNDRETALNERENAANSRNDKQERMQREFAAFYKARPDIKADDIPDEVFRQFINDGTPLLTAYTAWENARLKAELEAERKNKANAERATGSTSSAGGKKKSDPFEDAWYDGT